MKIIRVYHHHRDCEEYEAGMWRTVTGPNREYFSQLAAALMRDPPRFRSAMQQALILWPISCEANLSAESFNRQAWIGHAGCCIATRSPEETTRLGWHLLNSQEQDIANQMADEVIAEWELTQIIKQRAKCQNENLELMFSPLPASE